MRIFSRFYDVKYFFHFYFHFSVLVGGWPPPSGARPLILSGVIISDLFDSRNLEISKTLCKRVETCITNLHPVTCKVNPRGFSNLRFSVSAGLKGWVTCRNKPWGLTIHMRKGELSCIMFFFYENPGATISHGNKAYFYLNAKLISGVRHKSQELYFWNDECGVDKKGPKCSFRSNMIHRIDLKAPFSTFIWNWKWIEISKICQNFDNLLVHGGGGIYYRHSRVVMFYRNIFLGRNIVANFRTAKIQARTLTLKISDF